MSGTDTRTVVRPDPEHAAFRQLAIEALRKGQLRWRHHGIGVLQAYVEEGGPVEHRLHIWSRALLKPGIDVSGDAHDHRFDMVSHVLFGRILQREWWLFASPHGTWTTMTLVNARAAGEEHNHHAPMTPTGERYVRTVEDHVVRTGELYEFPARTFHQSPVSDFAITWVEKHNQAEVPARIAHPIDIPAVPAFGHDLDPELTIRLVELALRVLEETAP